MGKYTDIGGVVGGIGINVVGGYSGVASVDAASSGPGASSGRGAVAGSGAGISSGAGAASDSKGEGGFRADNSGVKGISGWVLAEVDSGGKNDDGDGRIAVNVAKGTKADAAKTCRRGG